MFGFHPLDIIDFETGYIEECVDAVCESSKALDTDEVDVVGFYALEKKDRIDEYAEDIIAAWKKGKTND